VPAKYLVTPSISKSRPFVLAKPVAVETAVDEVLVEEVLDFTDEVLVEEVLVLTEDVEDVDVDLEVEVVVTAVDVFDVEVEVEVGVAVPGTHW
jgi:hypothetical protein